MRFIKISTIVPKSDREKDNQSSFGDFGVRKSRQVGTKTYDDFTGRFFQIDPLFEKYYSWTPYHYSANNPVSRLDPSGLTDYVYTSKNEYYTENEDSWYLDWLIPDNYYAEVDGKRYEANSRETVTMYDWEDIWSDWETNQNGFNARIDDALSGKKDGEHGYDYALKESPENKKMDQKHKLSPPNGKKPQHSLYVYKGVAMNWREAGNPVWGATMRELNITWDVAVTAAHGYKSYSNKYPSFDETWGLKAAKLGYHGRKTFSIPIIGF